MACQLLEIEIELQHEYEEFIQTDEGQEWKKQWINELGCNIAGSFEDYLYDFYPEMLM